jgi:hypothetical protein
MRQIAPFRNLHMNTPDIGLLRGVVAPEIYAAMLIASAELTRLGVRHALVGGLAVGAHGWPRATKDVDFLVGPEGFERHGAIVTFKDKMPLRVGNVAVDPILYADGEEFLESGISLPHEGVPVAPIEVLIYMKLRSPRRKDEIDIIELVKSGIDNHFVLEYLQKNAPDLVVKFTGFVSRARSEE